MAKILEAQAFYDKLKYELKNQIKAFSPLTLASLTIGKDYSSGIYIACQYRLAKELGINYLTINLGANISLQKALAKIEQLNRDNEITAIVANKPFPPGFSEEAIFCAIDFKKDIEGMNPYNLGKLFIGEAIFISPTVLSILEFLKMTKVNLRGLRVTLVGFSNLIGKPLALLLGRQLATVSITHIATYEKKQLAFYIKNADIIISAVGKPNLIKGSWIRKNAVVIDVGIGSQNNKLAGDVEFKAACKKASFITPVPGGVGKLTSLFLFKNLIQAGQKYHG